MVMMATSIFDGALVVGCGVADNDESAFSFGSDSTKPHNPKIYRIRFARFKYDSHNVNPTPIISIAVMR